MRSAFEDYCSNIIETKRLIRPEVAVGMSDEDVLRHIRTGADKIAELKRKNDALLSEYIFGKDPHDLTEQDIEELIELADRLYENGIGIDVGIAYKIHCILFAVAELKDDRDLRIRELYYQGHSLNTLGFAERDMNINTFGERIYSLYTDGADYIREYEDIPSSDTRAYIIRCMGNRKYGKPSIRGNGDWKSECDAVFGYDDYNELFKQAMDVIKSDYYRKLNPELPWKSYEYAMHYDRTTYLSVLRSGCKDKELIKRIADDVLESAEYVYRHQEEIAMRKFQNIGARTMYVYVAAKYHAGKTDLQDVVNTLLSLVENADSNDHSSNGVMYNYGLVTYCHYYITKLDETSRSSFMPRYQEISKRSEKYLSEFPSSSFTQYMGAHVATHMKEQIQYDGSSRGQMMKYLLFGHPPTYVHSFMVATLTKCLFHRLIETKPEFLVGCFGTESIGEILSRSSELCDRAYRCGLYHDTGKNDVLSYVTIYGRWLLDEEFECIKYHTIMGWSLLKTYDDLTEEAHVALRHHRFYNDNGGYPNDCGDCPRSARAIVDIVSVADSLDAATDNIGRSYSMAKPFEALVGEFRQGSGTRYCPEVVELFDDRDFCQKIYSDMVKARQDVYVEVYSDLGKD